MPWPILPAQADYEEHTSSIVSVLLTNLTLGGHEQHALRVLRKFIENDYAKLERLVELHLKYAAKVNSCEQAIQQEIRELEVRWHQHLGQRYYFGCSPCGDPTFIKLGRS